MNTNSINSPFKTFDTNFRSHFDDFSLHSRDLDKMRNDNILDHCPEFAEYFSD